MLTSVILEQNVLQKWNILFCGLYLTQFENGELGKFLRVAIDKLPPQKQKICLLKIEYGLSNQEIADRMGITVPTVKSHYTQAIKALRNEIESLIIWFPVIWINLIV